MYEILKQFNYSTDGVTSVRYHVGEVRPVSDDLSIGLFEEGFIKDQNAKDSSVKTKKQK
jgi:hypothetical protein